MNFNSILFEISDGVGTITLNRPDVLNSFNKEMAMEVQQALDHCKENKEIRCLVLTANGRGFCAGQDLAEAMDENTPGIGHIVKHHYNPIVRKIREIEKPVLCAVNGVAAGAGANLAYACDITFAAESAKFIQSFANIGLIPDSGGTFTLPRLVGMQRATAMMMLGNKVTAKEAEQYGLIFQACADEQLMETTLTTAKRLAKMPTKGLGLTKRGLNKSMCNNLDSQLDLEEELQIAAGNSYDFNEGVQAFLEKRKPVFKGE